MKIVLFIWTSALILLLSAGSSMHQLYCTSFFFSISRTPPNLTSILHSKLMSGFSSSIDARRDDDADDSIDSGESTSNSKGSLWRPKCPKGSYSSTGRSPCKRCPAGTYASKRGSLSCLSCPVGTCSTAGQSICTPCSPGTYASTNGSSSCMRCRPGTVSYTNGSDWCRECGLYTISSIDGTKCETCPPGFIKTMGKNECEPCEYPSCGCPPGHYRLMGETKCTPCGYGQYAPAGQWSLPCVRCQPGTCPDAMAASCTECSPGTYATGSGNGYCPPCPTGLSSPAGASICT